VVVLSVAAAIVTVAVVIATRLPIRLRLESLRVPVAHKASAIGSG
jgi:hypothetical protein